jgi:DNA-binding XRE family transcriptional regulator
MLATQVQREANESMTAFQDYLSDFFDRPGSPSQSVVAAKAGISRVNLNRIIKGHVTPSLITAEAIAAATGSTLGRILKKSEKRGLVSA